MDCKMKKALYDWCNTHYEDFGYYPFDFEYNNKLYEIIIDKNGKFYLKECK